MAWKRKYKPSNLSKQEALRKVEHFCAYQERCHQEVKQKLADLQVYGHEADQIIAQLIEDNFINEQRFAEIYTRGKFRLKKWGKQRITLELKKRNISRYCIKAGLKEIDEDEYSKTLQKLLIKKYEWLDPEISIFIRKQRLIAYAMGKGYEIDLIYEILNRILPKTK